MRYIALASDYDGTLAANGRVDEATIRALERLIHSGRKLILNHRWSAKLNSGAAGIQA